MSNRYGLDFLQQEHVLDEIGSNEHRRKYPNDGATVLVDTEALAASVEKKPDLEKQFDVIHFLQAHRSAGFMPPSVIYQRTGISLEENVNVAQMLKRNPKIKVEVIPDPELPSETIDTYAYQAKYNNVKDRKTLLAQINRCKNGVPMRDMADSYDRVIFDLDALITAGDIMALHNTEDKDKVLFPRGEPFLVELDGIIVPPLERKNIAAKNEMMPPRRPVYCVETDSDPRSQLRRGGKYRNRPNFFPFTFLFPGRSNRFSKDGLIYNSFSQRLSKLEEPGFALVAPSRRDRSRINQLEQRHHFRLSL